MFSRGYPGPPARVAGPCRAAVSACSAPEPAGCRPALALQPPGACSRADQESVSARDRGQCAAWKLTHPGGAGTIGAGPLVSDAAGIQRVPGVRMESLRADSVFSRGYPETTCARGGALQGRCERVFRAGRAGCRPALALQPPGTCDRADPREPVSARDRGQCRLEIDPPRRRGGSRRRAVVSDAAGIQRVPGVGTESLRADSVFSRGYPGPPARVAGPCRAAVSACSAPEPAGCRPALALQPPGACSRADQESVSARDRGQCAAWKLTHPGGAGTIGAGPLVSDAAGIQRVPGVRMESLRADSAFSRGYPETTCARGGALQGRCERVFRAGPAGCRPALALQPPGTCDRADPGSACLRGSAGRAPLGS